MERASELSGTAAIMCWTFVLGPLGAFFLGCVAYAMVTGNFFLGVICCLAVMSPVFLTMVWGIVALMARVKRRKRLEQTSLRYLPAA
jgi:hypothetical protein